MNISNKNKLCNFLSELRKASAFIKKDIKISISYKFQFICQFLQIFFGIIVIYFIGKMFGQLDKTSALKQYGGDYFSFALIGLAINSYLKAGLINVTNDIRQIMNQGTLEAMCATPTPYGWLLVCTSLWQFIFETIRIIFHFAVAMLVFGMKLPNANWPAAFLTIVLTAPVFMMFGVISCSILVLVKRGDPISWVFSSLGAIMAGTMFPISVLPGWMQKVSLFFPLTHSLEAARKSLLMGANICLISKNLWSLAIFILVLIPLAITVNHLCMKRAKINGAFSTH